MTKDVTDSTNSNSEKKPVGRTAGEATLRENLESGLTSEKRKSIGEKLRQIDFGDAASRTQQALDESDSQESQDEPDEETTSSETQEVDSDSESSTDENVEAGETPSEETDEEIETGKSQDGTPTLPDSYRRSLKARGWADDEVDGFLKANPDLAMKTFDRIHQSRNAEIAAFAAAGRTVQAQNQSQTPGELKPANVEELVAKYGNEDIVKAFVMPVNESILALNTIVPEIQRGLQVIRKLQQDQIVGQIEGFFGNEVMKPYQEVYGTLRTGRSEGQKEKFHNVLERADQIRAGALAQGRQDISVEDALLAAHESLIGDYRMKAARAGIKKETKKRQAGITLKPGAKAGSTPTGDKAKDKAALERRVREGMKKAGLLR